MGRLVKWASGTVAGTTAITAVPTSVTASGNSDPINIGHVSRVMASVVCGVTSGTDEGLTVQLATQDPLGNWLPVLTFTKLTAAALGYGTAGPATANVYPLGDLVRFQWVIEGTDTPTFPSFAVSLMGR